MFQKNTCTINIQSSRKRSGKLRLAVKQRLQSLTTNVDIVSSFREITIDQKFNWLDHLNTVTIKQVKYIMQTAPHLRSLSTTDKTQVRTGMGFSASSAFSKIEAVQRIQEKGIQGKQCQTSPKVNASIAKNLQTRQFK